MNLYEKKLLELRTTFKIGHEELRGKLTYSWYDLQEERRKWEKKASNAYWWGIGVGLFFGLIAGVLLSILIKGG